MLLIRKTSSFLSNLTILNYNLKKLFSYNNIMINKLSYIYGFNKCFKFEYY